MTEADWRLCANPEPMLDFLHDKTSERKRRLFAVARFRAARPLLSENRNLEAIDILERYADGKATAEERRRAGRDARELHHEIEASAQDVESYQRSFASLILYRLVIAGSGAYAARDAYHATCFFQTADNDDDPSPLSQDRAIARFVRELFGNPFRLTCLDSSSLRWNDGTVPKIAEGIYEERAFARLPILHDALLDAGCDDEDILAHCRSAGPHVRGCWVIDLILGKE